MAQATCTFFKYLHLCYSLLDIFGDFAKISWVEKPHNNQHRKNKMVKDEQQIQKK